MAVDRPSRSERTRSASPVRRLSHLLSRPRLAAAVALFVATAAGLALLTEWRAPTIVLAAWNFAIVVYLGFVGHMMATSDPTTTLRRARRLDENGLRILVFAAAASVAGLLSVVAELGVVKDLGGVVRGLHVGLAAVTVVTAWIFIQTMFAIHYAHAHAIAVADGAQPGLCIPGEDRPDYWDFLYVAVAIGTSGQTADVEFTGKSARRIALAHSALAFFFNTTVLALAINIAAGLI